MADPISLSQRCSQHPRCGGEEEVELSRRVRKGDKEARHKMIRSNLVVISIANGMLTGCALERSH